MPTKLNGILIAGAPHSGKKTLGRLLESVLMSGENNYIIREDLRGIISWGLTLTDDLGKTLRKRIRLVKPILLPDELIERLFAAWLEAQTASGDASSKVFIVSDLPQTDQQVSLIAHFDRVQVVHIKATRQQALANLMQSIRNAPKTKHCEDPATQMLVLDHLLNEYERVTIPALARLNGTVVSVESTNPSIRLEFVLKHLERLTSEQSPVGRRKLVRGLFKLRHGIHRDHELLTELEARCA